MVFNIQRYSIHDGPGIRTTVFLKGCPLRCFWCHNPEGWRQTPDLQFWLHRCRHCRACEAACPNQVHTWLEGEHLLDRSRCQNCFRCVSECYDGALEKSGQELSVAAIMTQIRADAPFYHASGGGVTLSGGEPLQQAAFSLALLQTCRSAGFHTAVQTCAETEWRNLEAVLPYVDLFIIDIKVLDEQTHLRVTGKSNRRILENIRQLAALGKTIQCRIPVVPTVNDTADAIMDIRRFVRQLPGRQTEPELVPFHNMAAAKYQSLGRIYAANGLQNMSKEQLTRLHSVVP